MQRTKQKAQARTMGLQSQTKSFATAEQSAYPIRLSKMIAMVIVRSLIRLGIQCNPETLQPVSLQALQRAATGAQSRSSRKLRFRISGNDTRSPMQIFFKDCVKMLQFLLRYMNACQKVPSCLPSLRLTRQRRGMRHLYNRRSSE